LETISTIILTPIGVPNAIGLALDCSHLAEPLGNARRVTLYN
jgi:hypothetical protein